MGRRESLTLTERGQILSLNEDHVPPSDIARRIGRSRTVVRRFLSDPATYGKKKSPGRPKKLSSEAKQQLLLEAVKTGNSARALKDALQLSVSVRTVQDVLQDARNLRYKKRARCPVLLDRHRKARLDWAIEHVAHGDKWSSVVFSGEKAFNLDGVDGFQYYWHDLHHDNQVFSSQQADSESVCVWGAFSAKGTSELAFLERKQNAEKHIDTLGNYLFPFAHLKHGLEFEFQQDNALIPSAKIATEFLRDQAVEVMEWPVESPDLNPIENLWGVLARAVYASGKQYKTKPELVAAIKKAWSEISMTTLIKLVESMKMRCLLVFKGDGEQIKC